VLVINDPWLASGHLNDLTVVTPVFHRGRLAALTASTCHALDIGGRGLGTEAADCYEEGLLLPVSKLYAGGRPQQVLALLRANVREPEAVLGDVHAQVAGNALGAHRLQEMLAELELPDLDGLADQVFARSEAGMRAAIAAIPAGTYRHQVELDGFDQPVILRAAVTVAGSDLRGDYAGSSGPSRRGINVVLNYTRAYTTYGVKCVVAPDVPNNAGSFRPVTVTAPEGSILNARRPSPVACRHLVGLSLPDALIGALAQAVPARVVAQGSSSIWVVDTRGRGPDDRPYAYAFFASGGMGARADQDGLSATQFPSTVRNVPAEVIESVSPVVVHRRALAPDTGGAGQHRGGLGVVMEIGVRTRAEYLFTASFERVTVPPQGLFGGQPGARGRLQTAAGRPLDPMATHWLAPGERLVLQTPGGGGVGAPRLRDPERVAADVRERPRARPTASWSPRTGPRTPTPRARSARRAGGARPDQDGRPARGRGWFDHRRGATACPCALSAPAGARRPTHGRVSYPIPRRPSTHSATRPRLGRVTWSPGNRSSPRPNRSSPPRGMSCALAPGHAAGPPAPTRPSVCGSRGVGSPRARRTSSCPPEALARAPAAGLPCGGGRRHACPGVGGAGGGITKRCFALPTLRFRGLENPGDAVFCQECGTRLEAGCPSCGTPNQLGAKVLASGTRLYGSLLWTAGRSA
jgi:N-methylhydantoinase B